MSSLMDSFFKVQTFFRNMTSDIVIIYGEKGLEPFKKPLLFALPVLLVIYAMIYSPLKTKMKVRSAELFKFEVISQNFQEYSDAKSKLTYYQARLPLLKDKGEWLNYIINTNAKKNNMVIDSLSAQSETEISGFITASRSVTVTTSYDKLGVWLADIENSPIMLKVTELNFKRFDDRMGALQVNLKLSTIFPRTGVAAEPAAGGGS